MLESDPLSHMYSGDSNPLCVRLLLWSRVSSALEGDLLAPFRPFPSLKSMPPRPPPGITVHLRLKKSHTVVITRNLTCLATERTSEIIDLLLYPTFLPFYHAIPLIPTVVRIMGGTKQHAPFAFADVASSLFLLSPVTEVHLSYCVLN